MRRHQERMKRQRDLDSRLRLQRNLDEAAASSRNETESTTPGLTDASTVITTDTERNVVAANITPNQGSPDSVAVVESHQLPDEASIVSASHGDEPYDTNDQGYTNIKMNVFPAGSQYYENNPVPATSMNNGSPTSQEQPSAQEMQGKQRHANVQQLNHIGDWIDYPNDGAVHTTGFLPRLHIQGADENDDAMIGTTDDAEDATT